MIMDCWTSTVSMHAVCRSFNPVMGCSEQPKRHFIPKNLPKLSVNQNLGTLTTLVILSFKECNTTGTKEYEPNCAICRFVSRRKQKLGSQKTN